MAIPKTPLLSEPVFNLIKAKLQTDFNDSLANPEHQYDDGIAITPIDLNKIYNSDLFQPLAPPAIYIMVGYHDFQYGDKPNYMESEDFVTVVLTMEGVGADVMTTKAWRYGRLIYGILNLVDLFDGDNRVHLRLVPRRLGYTQPISTKLQGTDAKYRMDCVLELSIKHYEGEFTS